MMQSSREAATLAFRQVARVPSSMSLCTLILLLAFSLTALGGHGSNGHTRPRHSSTESSSATSKSSSASVGRLGIQLAFPNLEVQGNKMGDQRDLHASALGSIGGLQTAKVAEREEEEESETFPRTGERPKVRKSQGSFVLGRQPSRIAVKNNGGGIFLGPVRLYLIYYGKWTRGGVKQKIIETFARSFSNSTADKLGNSVRHWWLTTTMYSHPNGQRASASVSFIKSVFLPTTAALPDNESVEKVVTRVLKSGALPQDVNGVYAVLVSPDVAVNGMCSQFCGWHARVRMNNMWIKFLFAGDSSKCRWACSLATATPNGDFGADTLCNTLAHELTETVTDPDTATGWYDPLAQLENADLCQAYFPNITSMPGLPPHNVYGINGHKWLLQGNVDPRTQRCVVGLRQQSNAVAPSMPGFDGFAP